MGRAIITAIVLIASVGLAQAGTRADMSGDAVVDFATTMDMPFMTVGNPGNAGELSGSGAGGDGPDGICGAVGYEYRMGKFEVTAGQYVEFLNAVAVTDTYALYNTSMWSSDYGCKIGRSGPAGSYTYSVAADWEDRPVNYVTWGDSARFANWLTNGMPTGTQDLMTTEDGSYFLNGATSDAALLAVTREANARYVIPTEDEWYKAAYHENDGVTGNYYDYPTSSDIAPGYVNDSGNLSGTGTPFTEGGTDPGNYATYDGDYGTYGIGSPYFRTEAGEWENSESPYGTFDMGGNVWERNEAIMYGSYRGGRGGGFLTTVDNLALHASYRMYGIPTAEVGHLGFRVSEVPQLADFDGDRDVDADDIDALADAIRLGLTDAMYDLSGVGEDGTPDGLVDINDLDYLVRFLVETAIGNGTEYGDFNLDGLIDTTDLTRLATNYGDGDWKWDDGNANRNLDLMIDTTDLTILATYYGFGETDIVPEPATLSLLALGACLPLFRRKRR